MIYELRSYEVVPGRMPAMHARFKNHTVGLFKKHGIEVLGFWEAMIGTSNVLHYLCRFQDLAHRERAWAEFGADPEWLRVRAESEKDGHRGADPERDLAPRPYSDAVRGRDGPGSPRSWPRPAETSSHRRQAGRRVVTSRRRPRIPASE
jgi:hypothetical protein